MKDEYIIINKTAIQKRIEECNKMLTFVNKEYDIPYQKEIDVLQQIVSQSTPLIPEIEKAFGAGCRCEDWIDGRQDYISNLKLDI